MVEREFISIFLTWIGRKGYILTSYLPISHSSIKRGIRLLNGRRQILLQDDISGSTTDIQWRMHTNATVTTNGNTATLTLEGGVGRDGQ